MLFQQLLGPYGKIPILIRDDDTNFFTKPNMLDSIYEDAWKSGFKVSLAAIPCQKGTNDICVPPEARTTDSSFSIIDNKSLVNYLKEKIQNGNIEILQHGFDHKNSNNGRGEFGESFDKKKEILFGRDILKQSFEVEPKFFVPPGEDISKLNQNTLVNLGMVPICRQTFFDTFLRNIFVPSYFKMVALRALATTTKNMDPHANRIIQYIKPVVISVDNQIVSWSFLSMKSARLSSLDSLFDSTDDIIKFSTTNRSPICIINHYHIYYFDWNSSITRNDLYKAWRRVLGTLHSLKFSWKTSFSDLYERAKQIQQVHIVETGSKISILSKTRILGFSFRTRQPIENNDYLIIDQESGIITIKDLLPGMKIDLYKK